ncbi:MULTISPECIES: NRDE family protein [unclassified Sphingopyxis]|uniref:NRDE family protein n=1 Tax=unclassified Sphingopyxis TaxID=2614943 RepID=UPI00301319A6
MASGWRAPICTGMCVVALAHKAHPDWPLILIGNRDEFHARPAAPLAEWDDGSGIVAGRDLQAGGTWLGLHRPSGRIVVVTNVRGALPDPAKESRGALVVDLLRGHGRFAQPAEADLDSFNAFNLFAIDGTPRLLTNRPQPLVASLGTGVHALANEPVDRPCDRAERLRTALMATMEQVGDPVALLDLLAADDEPALFLRGPVYGTRCSSVVALDNNGTCVIAERSFDKSGTVTGQISFRIDALKTAD